MKGSAEASKHRSILDHKQHESKAMKQFREDDSLSLVREQFFEGSLPFDNIHTSSSSSKRKVVVDTNSLTPLERFHRIEARLRRIVVKACENSYAASKVVNTLEDFLIRVHHNGENNDERSREEWQEFLLDSPTVTTRRYSMKNKNQQHDEQDPSSTSSASINSRKLIIKFLFDADSATGGFHRLLLHGVCQFHCLRATSSTMQINGKEARVLTATGTFSGADVRLVDFITERQKSSSATGGSDDTSEQILSNKLSALKV